MKTFLRVLVAGFALALAGNAANAAEAVQAETKPASGSQCFPVNSWRNWTASKDGDALYLRINNNDVFRVDLTPGSRVHKYGNTFLVNQVRGSNWICSALDLNLTVADDIGVRQPLIAQSMRKLSPAEIAAIPKKERP